MRAVRRHDLAARVEMMPLIDVIFLLLTFFIYSMVMMVQAEILPVQMTSLDEGEVAQSGSMYALTINRDGNLIFNRSQVTMAELERQLQEFAGQTPTPTLFVSVEQEGKVDRAPMLLKLIERLSVAGIVDFTIVGQPGQTAGPGGP